MSTTPEDTTLAAVREMLATGHRPQLPPGLDESTDLSALLEELADIHRLALMISRGDLGYSLAATGSMAGALKTLQAALRHLTWQTQRVAAGDFSQRVDFMGDFSIAFNSMVVALGEAHSELAQRNEELQDLADQLEAMATHDFLTGAYNRRKLSELVTAEVARAIRYAQPLSLLILDLDHFKQVNDVHGHEAGDTVLVAVAGVLDNTIRSTDSLARWGGEEFVVLAPALGISGAVTLAQRLRTAIAAQEIPGVGQVTASFGVAEVRPDDTPDTLLDRADQALYRAKENGRDRVEPQA